MATKTLTVSNGQTITVSGLPVSLTMATITPTDGKAITTLTPNNLGSPSATGVYTIPAGTSGSVAVTQEDLPMLVTDAITAGNVITSYKVDVTDSGGTTTTSQPGTTVNLALGDSAHVTAEQGPASVEVTVEYEGTTEPTITPGAG